MALLTQLTRTGIGQFLTRLIFAKMTFLLPAKRLCETSNLLAFHHPAPSHPFHVLIVPRRPVASLAAIDPADAGFLCDLITVVQSLVRQFDLPAYRLVVNGGDYQDFPHLHFHLISDSFPPPAVAAGSEG